MRFVFMILTLFSLVGLSPAIAAEDTRPECDSCRFQIKSLDKPFKLTGKWLFTRDDNPQNKDVVLDTNSWPIIKAPGPWKNAYGDKKNFSVGWYRGNFEFDQSLVGQEVVLLINTYLARMNVYVDGQEIFRRPGNINIERYYAMQPVPVRFKVTQQHHVVAFRVDTPLMTGVYQLPLELHKYDKYDTSLAWYQFLNGEVRILVGFSIGLFGLFFLLVYAKTRYSLYLVAAIGSLATLPFFIGPSDFLLRIYAPEPLLYLHYTGMFMCFMAFMFSQFFYKFTPKTTKALGAIMGTMALVIASMMVHPNLDLFQKVRSAYFLVILLVGCGALYNSVRGALLKRPGAGVLVLGVGSFFVAAVHDMILAFGLIASMSMLFSGVLVFTISMLYVASNIFANTFVENKRLVHDLKIMNENLEDLVAQRTLQLRQKTNDIQTMLQNMPQGILTVVEGGVIHPEYSAYLEQIFETQAIAGKSMMELVFSNSSLGSDILSQVEAVAGACIGEDKMNFEFNTHLMVTEFDKSMPNGKVKSLELSWSPICNEDDVCEKLMLCVRDVTELKALAAEAGQQKRELEMIGQVLAVNQEKFHQFVDSSMQFIDENKQIIEKTNAKDLDTIGLLFRNMHTIKGNARTYGLLQLTNTVHETEQTYDNLRKHPEVEWDKAQLLEQLKDTFSALQEYAKVNEVKLGRKGPGRRGGVDKFLMVQKDHIESLIDTLERPDAKSEAVKDDLFRRVLGTLKQIGTEKIGDILAGVTDSLPSLAKELGKEPPVVVIHDQGIVVRNQIADLLKNSFMHLLRNSIDHGIETPDQRAAKGKQPVGKIELDLSVSGGRLWFKLHDDGKGLALGHIRRKAIESGLITEDQQVPPEQLAQMIFASGFSTAAAVTEVSGRGVGMDAVKGFIEREGGSIELHLTGDDANSEYRTFETIISLPEKFAVVVEA